MNGTISVYDGPGIRTSVFLKGYPLLCSGCPNPEGQFHDPEVIRTPNGCINCGSCLDKAYTENCRLIFRSERIIRCPQSLLRVCSTEYTPDELCTLLQKTRNFYVMVEALPFQVANLFIKASFSLNVLRS